MTEILLIMLLLSAIIITISYITIKLNDLSVYHKANENQLRNLATDIRANNKIIAKNNPNIILEN